jgi:hypothetical protein
VGKFVTLKASNFNKGQQLSTNGVQQIQYQSVRNSKSQQASKGVTSLFAFLGMDA